MADTCGLTELINTTAFVGTDLAFNCTDWVLEAVQPQIVKAFIVKNLQRGFADVNVSIDKLQRKLNLT